MTIRQLAQRLHHFGCNPGAQAARPEREENDVAIMGRPKPATAERIARSARALAAVMISALAVPVPASLGDPPPWPPAHGIRVKQEPYYLGYSGRKWESDYGVLDGHCNRQAVGAVLGSSGAAIDRQSAKGENRQVATVLGGILAAATGTSVSHDMDERDRACLGQALELAGAERGVTWTNPERGISFRVIPLGGFTENGQSCREFVTFFAVGRTEATVRHRACSGGDGVWQVIG